MVEVTLHKKKTIARLNFKYEKKLGGYWQLILWTGETKINVGSSPFGEWIWTGPPREVCEELGTKQKLYNSTQKVFKEQKV